MTFQYTLSFDSFDLSPDDPQDAPICTIGEAF